jgi:hypothetical protein
MLVFVQIVNTYLFDNFLEKSNVNLAIIRKYTIANVFGTLIGAILPMKKNE